MDSREGGWVGAWVVIVGLVRGGGGIEALSFSFWSEGVDSIVPSVGGSSGKGMMFSFADVLDVGGSLPGGGEVGIDGAGLVILRFASLADGLGFGV